MFRRGVELAGGGDFYDAAEVHDGDAVADVFDDRQVVRDEQIREIKLLLQVFEQVDDSRLNRYVERGDGLVADDVSTASILLYRV